MFINNGLFANVACCMLLQYYCYLSIFVYYVDILYYFFTTKRFLKIQCLFLVSDEYCKEWSKIPVIKCTLKLALMLTSSLAVRRDDRSTMTVTMVIITVTQHRTAFVLGVCKHYVNRAGEGVHLLQLATGHCN